MNKFQLLTNVAENGEEVVEETVSLTQRLNDSQGVTLAVIAVVVVIGVLVLIFKGKKGRK